MALLRLLAVTGDASRVTGKEKSTRHLSRVTRHDVVLIEGVHDGLRLAEALVGYERALVVDAAPWLPVGEVARYRLEDLPATAGYPHGLGFRAALEMLARVGEEGVPEVEVLAIGVPDDPPFGEGLSPAVEKALPTALEEAIRWLNEK